MWFVNVSACVHVQTGSAADDGHDIADWHVSLVSRHASFHRSACPSDLHGSSHSANEIATLASAFREFCRRRRPRRQVQAAEREPAAVPGVQLRRPAAGSPAAAVREGQHPSRPASSAELHQRESGVPGVPGRNATVHTAIQITPGTTAGSTTASSQAHHEQTGDQTNFMFPHTSSNLFLYLCTWLFRPRFGYSNMNKCTNVVKFFYLAVILIAARNKRSINEIHLCKFSANLGYSPQSYGLMDLFYDAFLFNFITWNYFLFIRLHQHTGLK